MLEEQEQSLCKHLNYVRLDVVINLELQSFTKKINVVEKQVRRISFITFI